MKVLVTGATGFVGRRLSAALGAAGHAIGALSRDPQRARADRPSLAEAWAWRPEDEAPPPGSLAWADAVVHLAGETVAGRWNAEKRRRIHDSRVGGTRHLVDGIGSQAAADRPAVLVSASAVGYYGDRGDEELDEDAAPGDGFLAGVCRDWEAEAARAEPLGVRVVRARIGLVLGRDGGALASLLPVFRAGAGGPLGGGRQWWPWIHVDDVVGLLVLAIEREALAGALNLAAPEPVRQKPFARALGAALDRPSFLPTPAFGLKLALGPFSEELLASRRVLARRAEEAGYRFRFPRLAEALADLVGEEGAERRRRRRPSDPYGDDDDVF